MQYVRNLSDSVSTAWNSINPATLSGAIDVIVVEREDGTLACSPFHVRFGKFSLLRPSEKKVEFKVNGEKQDYSMKLGEGGEAFFVFETSDNIPESMQTSPLVSPVSSPPLGPEESSNGLQDPDLLELDGESGQARRSVPSIIHAQTDEIGMITPLSTSPNPSNKGLISGDWPTRLNRPYSDDVLRQSARSDLQGEGAVERQSSPASVRSQSPPPLGPKEAIERAMALSKGLSAVNIPTHITETGDLMLDMTGFKSSEEDMLRAELLARNILSEEMDGNYDIGALFGFDEEGNLWVYSSEDAKQAAMSKTIESSLRAHRQNVAGDAVSDPGYQSDGSDITASPLRASHKRADSDVGLGLQTPPLSPMGSAAVLAKSYAKTLRLTSEQLKELKLKPGQNTMSFTVNRATCSANLYLWKHSTPVVVSDIDGTITKSDALGHVLNMIGRDWTHSGIAKLYSDIALNGYNIMYLTSRSVGQADTTRAYLNNIAQEGFKMPPGPTILSPDRTMAALRREVYLRKPHVFKMATLRDIRNLYGSDGDPFYAGFGNRLTDQISYRTVDVPRTRIFTINSNSEVSLDLLSLNKLKMTYVNINEVVDHYFPPIDTLVRGGREEYTDFMYWRDDPLQIDDFSASEDEDGDGDDHGSVYTDEEEEEEDMNDALADSYISDRRAGEGEDEEEYDEYEEEYDDDDDDANDTENEGADDLHDEVDEGTTAVKSGQVIEDVPAEVITGLDHLKFKTDHHHLVFQEPVEIRSPADSS